MATRPAPTHVTPSVAPPVTAFESDSCPICMESLTKIGCCTTPCGHQFCLGCFIKAYRMKPNCPICRDEMVTLRDVPLPVSLFPDLDLHRDMIRDEIRDLLISQLDGTGLYREVINELNVNADSDDDTDDVD